MKRKKSRMDVEFCVDKCVIFFCVNLLDSEKRGLTMVSISEFYQGDYKPPWFMLYTHSYHE